MSKKATIIAVVNQKGGTGKTTTTENLGVGLALEGKKVLLVDTDPQASLTVSLGNPCPDDLSPTLSDLMGKIMMENPITPDEGILHHPEGVDLVPSNIELSGMEVALVNAMSRETILRQYLDTVKQNYDYILLDCMPSLGSYLLIPRPKKRKELSAEAQRINREIDAELERDDPSDALIIVKTIEMAERLYAESDAHLQIAASIARKRVSLMTPQEEFSPAYFSDIAAYLTLGSGGKVILHTKTDVEIGDEENECNQDTQENNIGY